LTAVEIVMAGQRPFEERRRFRDTYVPAIHDFLVAAKTWMPGARPGMTASGY
jgi:hypothetical protein